VRLLSLLVCLATVKVGRAQSHMGGARGTVRAPDGVVAGAVVELLDENSRFTRHTASNSSGEYVFSSVTPGTYTLRVSARGFKTVESAGVRIGTQQFIALDLQLEVGAFQEQVSVRPLSPLFENASAGVGSTLERSRLLLLPSTGRNPFYMSVTTPNVLHTADPQFVRQQDQTSSSHLTLAGGPLRSSNYTIDGVPITDLRNRAALIPSLEATEEVKVQLGAYDAEVGRTDGGVFNTTFRSGSNAWRGGLLGQTRPRWAQDRLYFDRRACQAARRAGRQCAPKPDTHYYLFAGSLGGPIRRDQTFFWASFEGYRTRTARNTILFLPTERERQGDFSQSGLTIYDPLTTRPDGQGGYVRDPFPGNVIPSDRLNPVASAVLGYLPLPSSGNTKQAVAELQDVANQATLKLDHRFGDRLQSSLTYAWYESEEPEPLFYSNKRGANPGDPAEGAVFRTVHVLALNNAFVPGANQVLQLRYGYTSFADDDRPNPFDPAVLGFSPQFLDQITFRKFPQIGMSPYSGLGDRSLQDTSYRSHHASLGHTRLLGRHNLKLGADYRHFGLALFAAGQSSGRFVFSGDFTRGPNPLAPARETGSPVASLLLGYANSGDITVGTPNSFSIDYYGAYVQDDVRLGSSLILSLGLRGEFEQGLKERRNRFTVGFDRDRPWPFHVPGVSLRGGLQYAGVDGYPTYQGQPPPIKLAPRLGLVWSLDERTVVRGGYGRFWAPIQYAFPSESRLGTRGFTAITDYVASLDGGLTPCPGCSLTDPFPAGVQQPRGSADGILTGAGGTLTFVDQFRHSPYVDRFSVDVQRQWIAGIVASVAYVGSRSHQLSVGGIDAGVVNINQLDPRLLSLGAALLDQVPNPFFGDPRFGALATPETLPRGQLLRPYPQFGDVYAHQVSRGKARYHSVVLRLQRWVQDGWGGDINYTLSSLKDNIFGNGSPLASNPGAPLDNYGLESDAEYGPSLRDAPHRLNVVLACELPVGEGKRWLSRPSLWRALLGGWTLSLAGSLQSGFPAAIVNHNNNSGLSGTVQRPNLTGLPPARPGSTEARVETGWFNPAAWTEPPAFTLGNAPRADTRVRTPSRRQTDIALLKTQRVGGKRTLTVRAEVINLFNDPNFHSPATAFGRADFGRITNVGGFPRLLQLMAQFRF
jgi:hypothetical protein